MVQQRRQARGEPSEGEMDRGIMGTGLVFGSLRRSNFPDLLEVARGGGLHGKSYP